jgi:uncharacterized protein YeaO (DUF488 family)
MATVLKHVGEPADAADGVRVLVERRLPRERGKEELELAAWLPTLAPSVELARWFGASRQRWMLFRRRYLMQLAETDADQELNRLYEVAAAEKRVTLLTSASDPELSHAAILRDLLEGARKPPATSGPAGIARAQSRTRRPRP